MARMVGALEPGPGDHAVNAPEHGLQRPASALAQQAARFGIADRYHSFFGDEQVTVVGPKGRIERVRVLGPTRKASQVEIAMTEQFKLGVHPPVRESGDLAGTPGCTLEGPAGSVTLEQGVICALRHIHMPPEDALRYGVRDKTYVRVRVGARTPGDPFVVLLAVGTKPRRRKVRS